MYGAHEFWLALHRVVAAYRDEGLTTDDRLESILEQFSQMPAIARRELLADFAQVAVNFQDIYVACVASQRQIEESKGKKPEVGVA